MFKWTSLLGVAAALFIAVGVALVRYFTGTPHQSPPTFQPAKDSAALLKVVPVFTFAFECHIEIPPMVATLKEKTMSYYMKMAIAYVSMSASVYTCAAVFGYLTFGDSIPGDLLLAYDREDRLVLTAMILITVKIIATFPTLIYCVRLVFAEIWQRNDSLQGRIPAQSLLGRFLQVLPVFLLAVCVAVVAPGITEVISVLGSLSAVCIFIYPGLCFIQMMLSAAEISGYYRKICLFGGIVMTVIGTFLMCSSFIMAIQDYRSSSTSGEGRCS